MSSGYDTLAQVQDAAGLYAASARDSIEEAEAVLVELAEVFFRGSA